MYAYEIEGWLEGKKIRRKAWFSKEHVYWDKATKVWWRYENLDERLDWELSMLFNEDDWEEYQEPKTKKRYWLWDVLPDRGAIFKTEHYLDEERKDTVGTSLPACFTLLKKHENEFIDI